MKKDLVIPLGIGSTWNNNELRYALRSYDKYFKNLGNVYIVGDKAYIDGELPWLTGVEIVHCGDPNRRNKDANIINKVLKVINEYPVTKDFIRASDDMLLLKEVDELLPFYSFDMRKKEQAWWRGNRWKQRLKRTMRILFVKKKTTFNYDVHIPMQVSAKQFKKIFVDTDPYNRFNMSIGFTINSLYYNVALTEHQQLDLSTRLDLDKVSIEVANILVKKMIGKTYLIYNNHGLNQVLRDAIVKKFPDPCRFELGFETDGEQIFGETKETVKEKPTAIRKPAPKVEKHQVVEVAYGEEEYRQSLAAAKGSDNDHFKIECYERALKFKSSGAVKGMLNKAKKELEVNVE